jgi:hypothetical protein
LWLKCGYEKLTNLGECALNQTFVPVSERTKWSVVGLVILNIKTAVKDDIVKKCNKKCTTHTMMCQIYVNRYSIKHALTSKKLKEKINKDCVVILLSVLLVYINTNKETSGESI